MKKRALMALPKLTATDEMKQIAASDLPRKEKTTYGYVREVCEYYAYLRCITQDGILKVAFFLPEHLHLNGSNDGFPLVPGQGFCQNTAEHGFAAAGASPDGDNFTHNEDSPSLI